MQLNPIPESDDPMETWFITCVIIYWPGDAHCYGATEFNLFS